MSRDRIHVVSAGRETFIAPAKNAVGELWISASALEESTGWTLSPEGLCRDDVCLVLRPADRAQWIDGDALCVSEMWKKLGRPVLHDEAQSAWLLGEAASDRNAALATLAAPDFTLPDITGKLHSLSDFRGSKVLLATWASW
jgi:hypothetical protein